MRKTIVILSGVLMLLAAGPTAYADVCDCPHQGDINADNVIDAFDLVFVVDFVFRNGPQPPSDITCPLNHRGDVSCDGIANLVDVVRLVNIVFHGGTVPCNPCPSNPNPECVGAECFTFLPCNLPNSCLSPICVTTAEGTGVCIEGETPCEGLLPCNDSGDCPPGWICAVATCCGEPVCLPPEAFCRSGDSVKSAAPPPVTHGPTVGNPN